MPAADADVTPATAVPAVLRRCRVGGIGSSATNTATAGTPPVSPTTIYLPFAIADGAGGAAAADAGDNSGGSGVTRLHPHLQNPPNFENVKSPRRLDIPTYNCG
jgi:hypothetical protein